MMKRLLPLLLVLCMLLVSCTTPTETTGAPAGNNNPGNNNNDPKPVIDIAGVEKDPLGAITDANEKTEPVIQDDAKIFEIIMGALTEGTTTLSLTSPALLAQMGLADAEALSATLKSDIANGKLHLSVPNFFVNDDPSALLDLYLDGSKLGVQGEMLLGFAGTYFADLSNEAKLTAFIELLESMFAATEPAPVDNVEEPAEGEVGFDPAMIQMYIEQIKAIIEAFGEDYTLDMEAITNAALGNLKPTVKSEEIKVGASTVKCIAVTYTIDVQTICDILVDVLAEIEIPADVMDLLNQTADSNMTVADLRKMLNDTIAQIGESIQTEMAPKLTVKTLINAFTGKLHGITLTANAKITSEEYDWNTDTYLPVTKDSTLSLEVLYTNAGRKITLTVKENGEVSSLSASLVRDVKGYDVTYTAKLETNSEGEKVTLEIPMVYNTHTGVITVTMKMTQDGETQMIILNGSAKAEGNTATFTIDSIAAETQILPIGLSIVFTKGLSEPIAIPENAIDVTALTEEQIAELFSQMENGLLFQLIGSMGEGTPDNNDTIE